MRIAKFLYHDERDSLEKKYKRVVDKHYSLLEKFEDAYKNGKLEKTIQLCKEDISLVDDLSEYWDAFVRLGDINGRPLFPAYKRLAIVYEKQGRIEDAIKVCEDAIRAGYSKDGTSGGMEVRVKKLRGKL